MKKLILTLALLFSAVISRGQTYESDGALRTMNQTHIWNNGTQSWDKWPGTNTYAPGTTDTFGHLMTGFQWNQIDMPFFRIAPAQLLTITTTNGGSASSINGGALFATGTNTNGTVKGVTTTEVQYRAGSEVYAYVTASFTAGVASSYERVGLYDTNNGVFIGYEGTTFGVTIRDAGVDTQTAQASFNGDPLDGSATSAFTRAGVPEALDKTKINVYRFRFGWLGAAPVSFDVLSPDGKWVTFHTIRQPNSATTPSIENPDLPMTVDIAKTAAGASNLQIFSGCWGAGITQSQWADYAGAGSISALNGTVTVNTNGAAALMFNLAGTWTGTVSYQATVDNLTWVSIIGLDQAQGAATLTTGNQRVYVNPAGFQKVRLIATAWTSGQVDVTYNRSNVAPNIFQIWNTNSSSLQAAVRGVVANGSATLVNPVPVAGYDGANVRVVRTATDGTVRVDPTGTTTQPVSAASLPLPTGAATEATLSTFNGKLPAGANPADNETNANAISRIGGYTFVFDGSAWDRWTGLVSAAQSGAWTVAATQSGGWTVTANAGTNLNTSALALDATITNRLPAGSTPANGESNAITTSRLGAYNFVFNGSTWDRWTGAISGTVTANQGGAPWSFTSTQLPAALVGGRLDVNVGNTPAVTQSGGPWTINLTQLAGATPSATNPFPSRLSDGTSFYNTNTAAQLPAALVGGRLDINLGAVGGTAQSGAQLVDVGNTAWRVNCITGCAGSSFADSSAFTFGGTTISNTGWVVDDVATNTVAENSAGAPRMNTNRIAYFNPRNNAGTEIATLANPFRIDPTGTTTQPVSGTVTANQGGNWTSRIVGNVGATLDSTVAPGTAPANQVVVGSVFNAAAIAPTNGQAMAQQADQAGNLRITPGIATATLSVWNSGTALNSTQNIYTNSGVGDALVHLAQTTPFTTGAITFEVTFDGTNWVTAPSDAVLDPAEGSVTASALAQANPDFPRIPLPYTLVANANKPFLIVSKGWQGLRIKLSTAITGAGTVTPTYALLSSEAVASIFAIPAGPRGITTNLNMGSVAVPMILTEVAGYSSISLQFVGSTGSGQVTFQTSNDKTTWSTVYCGNGTISHVAQTSVVTPPGAAVWNCPTEGARYFRVNIVTTDGAANPQIAWQLSPVPHMSYTSQRPASQWTVGSSPYFAAGGGNELPGPLYTPEGFQAVTMDHPRSFSCSMSSTAITSTVITGCFGAVATLAAPGAGLRFYITSYSWASSIISTTTNFMTLQYGTGGTCGTGTTPFHRGFIPAAFNTVVPDVGDMPIRLGTNSEVCFIHPGAGTRFINIRGYVAP